MSKHKFEGEVPQTLQIPEGYFDFALQNVYTARSKQGNLIDGIRDDMNYTDTVKHQAKLELAHDDTLAAESMLGAIAFALIMSQLEKEKN